MKRLTIAVLALPLMAFRCSSGDERPAIAFPTLKDLPANIAAPCPGLPDVTGSFGDLAAKDAATAIAYASCSAAKDAAIGAYRDAQAALAGAKAKAEKP